MHVMGKPEEQGERGGGGRRGEGWIGGEIEEIFETIITENIPQFNDRKQTRDPESPVTIKQKIPPQKWNQTKQTTENYTKVCHIQEKKILKEAIDKRQLYLHRSIDKNYVWLLRNHTSKKRLVINCWKKNSPT